MPRGATFSGYAGKKRRNAWKGREELAWMIQYEWLLFFALILAVAIVDLVRTRRDLRRAREKMTGASADPDHRTLDHGK
jgi:hypothetical protein